MEIISNPTQVEIKKAAQALKDGHLVAFPTETVYGLGADATNEKAVSSVYSVKGRPTDHPLIVHISSINQLDKWAVNIPKYAIKLAEEFWPGPMTLILKRGFIAKDYVTGRQDSIGLRVPNHVLALSLINEFEKFGGIGIAAPSANRFGAVSPTSAEAVKDELGNYLHSKDLILDGGKSIIGIESTIIGCSRDYPVVLRPGATTTEMVENVAGVKIPVNLEKNEIRTSGLLEAHYSPKAKVLLNKLVKPGDGFIAAQNIKTPKGAIRLSSPANIEQYANDLYQALRSGDQKMLKRIVVIPPTGEGLASAIRDRLHKAAAGYSTL
jgi:L-threonylcarbamoyladenylate synthase